MLLGTINNSRTLYEYVVFWKWYLYQVQHVSRNVRQRDLIDTQSSSEYSYVQGLLALWEIIPSMAERVININGSFEHLDS